MTIQAPNMIDIVGTGGDGTSTFNVSTAASFVGDGATLNLEAHQLARESIDAGKAQSAKDAYAAATQVASGVS